MTTWRITLFGQLRIWHNHTEIKAFQHRKAGVLLSYLACYQGTWHNRNHIATHLWPDSDTDAAKLSLRVSLSRIRERLGGGEALQSEGERLRLNPDYVQVDVTEFSKAITEKNWQTAVTIYTAPLLPHYDEFWVSTERQRLTDDFLTALFQLSEIAHKKQNWDVAIEFARRAVQTDPYREDTHKNLIALYLAASRPAAAQAHFKEMEKQFREELNILPSLETRALITNVTKQTLPKSVQNQKHGITKSNLPRTNTPFFGRESEQDNLLEIISQPGALVSLVGFGGIGKTRLALEVAKQTTSIKVFWLPLAEVLPDDTLWEILSSQLSQQTNLTLQLPSLTAEERVIAVLEEQPALLLIDNAEHLNGETLRSVIQIIQTKVPEIRLLITSRHPLHLAEEQIIPLTSLEPQAGHLLFEDRARRTRSDFSITERNSNTVATLCAQLEGIPLAIEMAAARTSILTPEQIQRHINEHFNLLINQKKDTPSRHQTLETLVDWSYQLLTPNQQNFLCSLSTFRNGWTIEAAQAISQSEQTIENIQNLVDHSLIYPYEIEYTNNTYSIRYNQLDILRKFTESRVSTKDHHRWGQCHTKWIISHFKSYSSDSLATYPEHDNLINAIKWSLSHGYDEFKDFFIPIMETVKDYWPATNRHSEALSLYMTAINKFGSAVTEYPELLDRTAFLAASTQNRQIIQSLFEWCNKLNFQDNKAKSYAMSAQGSLLMSIGDMNASRKNYAKSYIYAKKSKIPNTMPLFNIALTYNYEENHEKAQYYYERAWLEAGKPEGKLKGIVLCMRGQLNVQNKQIECGISEIEESIDIFKKIGDLFSESRAHLTLAKSYFAAEETDKAFKKCVDIMSKLLENNLLTLYHESSLLISDILMKNNNGYNAVILLSHIKNHFAANPLEISESSREDLNRRYINALSICSHGSKEAIKQGKSTSFNEMIDYLKSIDL